MIITVYDCWIQATNATSGLNNNFSITNIGFSYSLLNLVTLKAVIDGGLNLHTHPYASGLTLKKSACQKVWVWERVLKEKEKAPSLS